MEKTPTYKSTTKIFELTDIEKLNEYTSILSNIANNIHKYTLIDNCLQLDMFGNPFIILQIKDNIDLEEKKVKTFSFFGQIISEVNLVNYDQLTDDHWADIIRLVYCDDFYVKDKENPMYYKIVIYYKINDSNILQSDFAKLLMPRRI